MDENKINEALGLTHLSRQKYMFGFALAVVLTLVAFITVAIDALPKPLVLAILFITAIVQIVVHLHYFLHLDRSNKQRWNLVSLAFSLLLIFIFVGGSIWVMITLNARMMM